MKNKTSKTEQPCTLQSVNGRFFPKSELKGDMLLKFRNGKYMFVWHNVDKIGDYLMSPFDLPDEMTSRGCLADLTDDLYYNFWCYKRKKIVKVPCVAIYGSNAPGRLGLADLDSRFRQPIWNRYRRLKTCR